MSLGCACQKHWLACRPASGVCPWRRYSRAIAYELPRPSEDPSLVLPVIVCVVAIVHIPILPRSRRDVQRFCLPACFRGAILGDSRRGEELRLTYRRRDNHDLSSIDAETRYLRGASDSQAGSRRARLKAVRLGNVLVNRVRPDPRLLNRDPRPHNSASRSSGVQSAFGRTTVTRCRKIGGRAHGAGTAAQ